VKAQLLSITFYSSQLLQLLGIGILYSFTLQQFGTVEEFVLLLSSLSISGGSDEDETDVIVVGKMIPQATIHTKAISL